jgi:lysylphosphatidylglycerol synthetase-like protein (DUF2156 family)
MSLFEYVMILVSVILSLGIARILENHGHLLKMEAQVRWSPTYLLWLLIIFFSHVDLWASLWMVRDSASWSLFSLLSVLLAAVALFYAAILSVPETGHGQPVDLWAFHLDNRQRFVGALVGYFIMGAVLNTTLLTGHFDLATVTATLPGVGLGLVAMLVRARWVQMLVPILLAGMMIAYFLTYFSSLRA